MMSEPINMLLPCPNCRTLHVDAPEPASDWTNPPHKSHLCHFCKTVWRPADIPTNGVAEIQTRGEKDTWRPEKCYGCDGIKSYEDEFCKECLERFANEGQEVVY
jgi:hypothetical protein